jgi:hypothetical protein
MFGVSMIVGKTVTLENLIKFSQSRKIIAQQAIEYGSLILFEDGTAISVDGFEIGIPTCRIFEDYDKQLKHHFQMLDQSRKIAALNGQKFEEPKGHPCDQYEELSE